MFFIVVIAILNLAFGFALAMYLGGHYQMRRIFGIKIPFPRKAVPKAAGIRAAVSVKSTPKPSSEPQAIPEAMEPNVQNEPQTISEAVESTPPLLDESPTESPAAEATPEPGTEPQPVPELVA